MAAVTLFLILTLTVVLLNTQAVFAVYYNGAPIGSTKNMEDVAVIVTDAEEQLTEIFGYDYSLDNTITVSPELGASADDTENIKNAILDEVEGVAKMYVLEVNGNPVGAAEDGELLDGILNRILDDYSTPLTLMARFTDDVTVRSRFVRQDVIQDTQEIQRLLDPENTSSPHSLTVQNIEQHRYDAEIPFAVQYVNDATIYEGNSEIATAGTLGVKLVTENSTFVNGLLTSSQIVETTVIKESGTEIVAVGTALRPKTASYGYYIWPSEGVITSGFGPRTGFGSSNHQGIDIGSFYGEDIVASDGGKVIMADWYSGYGLMVQIRHDNGDITYYGHCSELLVQEGDLVYQGQVIARMGATGVASGVHCHFEIRVDGVPVNPINLLP